MNSFLEDTAVLVATAFLIVRGPLERMLANPWFAGLAFGALSASEAVFPNARFPYASHTLGCALITALMGWRAGFITAIIAWVAAIALLSPANSELIGLQLGITLAIVGFIPKPIHHRGTFNVALIALGQGVCVALSHVFPDAQESLRSPWTIAANTFGVVLLGLVIKDARTRGEAARHRTEVAEAKTRTVEVQLLMLRGRVHPHFLYNALTSIAALCEISPKRASKAAINLGSLMRESLEQGIGESRSLDRELETVKSYTDIELERFGPKLKVDYDVGDCGQVHVPPFGVQILVENAILHGVSQMTGGGSVQIVSRKKSKFAYIAVADNGRGLPTQAWRTDTHHGLTILEGLICSQTHMGGRLKLVRRLNGGTLAVIRVPLRSGRI